MDRWWMDTEGNIILSWSIWKSGAADWGSSLGWSGWSWPVSARPIRCCSASFDTWIWWFLIIFRRFLGWGPNGGSRCSWIMKYSWGTACSCRLSTPTNQHSAFSWTPLFCWGTWWWWLATPANLLSVFATSWLNWRSSHRICIKEGLLELGNEEGIILALNFYLDLADIRLHSLNKQSNYKGIDLEVDLFIAAQVIDVPIVINVFHVDRDAVVVEKSVASDWIKSQVLRLGCWVSLERWLDCLDLISLYYSFSIILINWRILCSV